MSCWDRSFRDLRLDPAQARDYILQGLTAADKALAIDAERLDALTWKTLLLRVLASTEQDPDRRAALVGEAHRVRARAVELQKKMSVRRG